MSDSTKRQPPSPPRRQRTLVRPTEVSGVSYLGGLDVRLRFLPAAADAGVSFVRVDLPDRPVVPAQISRVVPRRRRTSIQEGAAVVEMIEHVMAALAGLRIDNCRIEIDGPETPALDGSSRAFVDALRDAGAVEQDRTRKRLYVDKPISVRDGAAGISAVPSERDELVLSYNLDYGNDNPIGRQSRFIEMSPESFESELAASRTFLLQSEADALRASGVGPRVTPKDLLIYGPEGVVDNEPRYPDECVRHKLLDLVGDLALAGVDLVGHVSAHRSGHQLNAALVRAILESAESNRPAADVSSLDINEIMKALPHRFPFLLVDRVLELIPKTRVLAIKNVSINEPFFQGHWPARPVMPGVLILEALAQAAGVLIERECGGLGRSALLTSLDDVKLRKPATPGDQLMLEVEVVRLKSRTADMKGVARIGDQTVAEARLRFVVVETDSIA